MGLRDHVNRAESAGDDARAAALGRAEAVYATASRVWADFLSSCREFAQMAPGKGVPPRTGKQVLAQVRNKERGNSDHVVVHPGGWAFDPGGWVFGLGGVMFYIRTDGTLMVQQQKIRKRMAVLPSRTLFLCVFEPCPAFPSSAAALLGATDADRSVMPWKFRLLRSGAISYGTRSEAVQEDLRRLGGALAVDTYAMDGDSMKLVFAKDLLISRLAAH
jgi:hypothetical protein